MPQELTQLRAHGWGDLQADTRKCINQLLAESLPLEEAGGDIQVLAAFLHAMGLDESWPLHMT